MYRYFSAGLVAVAVALFVWATLVSPASGQGLHCATRVDVARQLESEFGERLIARGVGSDGRSVEVFASAVGRSWTIVLVGASGVACLAAEGVSWEVVEQPLGEAPEPGLPAESDTRAGN